MSFEIHSFFFCIVFLTFTKWREKKKKLLKLKLDFFFFSFFLQFTIFMTDKQVMYFLKSKNNSFKLFCQTVSLRDQKQNNDRSVTLLPRIIGGACIKGVGWLCLFHHEMQPDKIRLKSQHAHNAKIVWGHSLYISSSLLPRTETQLE